MITEKLERLGSREKAGLVVAMVLIFGVLVDRFAVDFIVSRFQELKEETRRERRRLAENVFTLEKQGSVGKAYEGLQGRLGRVKSGSEAIDDLKGMMDELARQTGIVIVSMKHRDSGLVGGCREFTVDIGRFEAGMRELLTFVRRVRESPKLLRVTRLTITPGDSGERISGSMQVTRLMEVEETSETESDESAQGV